MQELGVAQQHKNITKAMQLLEKAIALLNTVENVSDTNNVLQLQLEDLNEVQYELELTGLV